MNLKVAMNVDANNPHIGDLYLNDAGTLAYSVDATAEDVAQILRSRILFFKGEWFLDQREGVPYFEEILTKNPSLEVIRSIYRGVISKTPGVLAVVSLTLLPDYPNRVLTVSFSVIYDGVNGAIDVPPFLVEL